MKELYVRPELEIELFKTEDIITASVEGDNDTEPGNDWEGWGRTEGNN